MTVDISLNEMHYITVRIWISSTIINQSIYLVTPQKLPECVYKFILDDHCQLINHKALRLQQSGLKTRSKWYRKHIM